MVGTIRRLCLEMRPFGDAAIVNRSRISSRRREAEKGEAFVNQSRPLFLSAFPSVHADDGAVAELDDGELNDLICGSHRS